MKLQCPAAKLQAYVDALNVAVDEAKIVKDDEESVRVVATNAAHTLLVNARLSARKAGQLLPPKAPIGVDLDKLGDALGVAEKEETVTLEASGGKLRIQYGALDRSMSLVDTTNMQDAKIPEIDYTANGHIELGAFKRGVKACQGIADHARFTVDDGTFEVSAATKLDSVEYAPKRCQFTGEADSLFSLGYLMQISNGSTPAQRLHLDLGHNLPARMTWQAYDGDLDVEYMLAPRIEND